MPSAGPPGRPGFWRCRMLIFAYQIRSATFLCDSSSTTLLRLQLPRRQCCLLGGDLRDAAGGRRRQGTPPPRLGTENAVGTLLPLVPLLFFVKMQLPKNPLFQGYRLGSGALTDIHVPFPTPCPRARAEPGPTLSTHDNPRIPIERWNSKSGAVYFDTGWPTSCQRGLAAGKIYRGVKKIEVHPPAASLLTRGIRNRKNGPSDPNER